MTKKNKDQHDVLIPGRWVERIEELFHIVLGVFLLGIAIAALYFSVVRVFETTPFFPTGMIQAINDILFIIIILEILRTVVARYTDGVFQLQNFLIIGVIGHKLDFSNESRIHSYGRWPCYRFGRSR